MPSQTLQSCAVLVTALAISMTARADDLHIKKNLSMDGSTISTTETAIKGARERSLSGPNITLRQCDLRRTITLSDQTQTYFIANDPVEEKPAAAKSPKASKAEPPKSEAGEANGGKIVVTTSVTDTGERKTMFGYPARHLKSIVTEESSPEACSKVSQKIEIDGWYTDLGKEQAACSASASAIPAQGPLPSGKQGCNDKLVMRHTGTGRPGYPLSETMTFQMGDTKPYTMKAQVEEIGKQNLEPELFEIPKGYQQVHSMAELRPGSGGVVLAAAHEQMQAAAMNQVQDTAPVTQQQVPPPAKHSGMSLMSMMSNVMGKGIGNGTMGGQQQVAASVQVAAPRVLGPKAPGKLRIGIAPPEAQVGQGSNAGADYSTPIRNSIILLMDGPAVEIAALDSHVPMQLQAEAQQKQCDYVLFSGVTVKHPTSGGLGKFMKMAAPIANLTPMGMMTHGVGSMVAAQAAAQAASAMAQQQAMSQLSGFNNTIKSKDDVTVQFQLFPTGQPTPRLQNALQGKAKSDGEDVLTPLIQQVATTVLTEVTKK